MADLSVEVIEDILSRLPVIDLLRFRCVSKPWCSLIDSSLFIKLHLNRSIETTTNLNLVLNDRTSNEFHFLDYDSLDRLTTKLLNGKDFEGLKTEVLGSSNGLLCLSTVEKGIVLWNPSTRNYRKLPVPIDNPNPSWVSFTVLYGFGFVPTSDDYKILRIVQFYFRNYDKNAHESLVDVYSLKSNSWGRVQYFPHFTLDRHAHDCVLVDDALHFVGTLINEFSIIAFDLGVEEFRFVPQPEYSYSSIIHMRVGVLGGSLCLLSCCKYFAFDLWVMKDYGVEQSCWTKIFSVEGMDVRVPCKFLKPIACSTSGGKILIQLDDNRLFQYDSKKKRIKEVKIRGMPVSFQIIVCLGTLVQLDCAGGSDRKQHRKRRKRFQTLLQLSQQSNY